jgi:hypothetical protein
VNGLEDFDSEVTPVTPVTTASAQRADEPSRLSPAPTPPDEPFFKADDFVPPHAARLSDGEPLSAQQLADTINLSQPEVAYASPRRSHPSTWAIALGVGVLMGFAGWYALGGWTHRTPAAPSTPLASASSPAPRDIETPVASPSPPASGVEAPAGPVRTEAPQTQPVLPASGARADITPQAEDSGAELTTRDGSAPGRLLVRSTPSGARVFVDDQESGVTPATIRDLAARSHRIRVTLEGYVGQEKQIFVTSARPTRPVTFDLDLDQAHVPANLQDRDSTQGITGTLVGALSVESRPAGANVYIDDLLAGQTPLWLPRVEAGTHAIRLELDRHRRWSTSVRVVSGRPNRVGASLEEQDQPDQEPTLSPSTGVRRRQADIGTRER